MPPQAFVTINQSKNCAFFMSPSFSATSDDVYSKSKIFTLKWCKHTKCDNCEKNKHERSVYKNVCGDTVILNNVYGANATSIIWNMIIVSITFVNVMSSFYDKCSGRFTLKLEPHWGDICELVTK